MISWSSSAVFPNDARYNDCAVIIDTVENKVDGAKAGGRGVRVPLLMLMMTSRARSRWQEAPEPYKPTDAATRLEINQSR